MFGERQKSFFSLFHSNHNENAYENCYLENENKRKWGKTQTSEIQCMNILA